MRLVKALAILLLASPATAHHVPDRAVVTLFVIDFSEPGRKVHVATFDSNRVGGAGTVFKTNWDMCVRVLQMISPSPSLLKDSKGANMCEPGYGVTTERWHSR